MQIKRSLRVAGLLKKELGDILMREVKDPSVRLATITKVKLTDDLKLAKIYVSTIGNESTRKDLMQGLERAKKFIRAEVGHRIDLRYVPELNFFYDDTFDYVESIDHLIRKIHSEGT
jgi:ribosome-binding factor A